MWAGLLWFPFICKQIKQKCLRVPGLLLNRLGLVWQLSEMQYLSWRRKDLRDLQNVTKIRDIRGGKRQVRTFVKVVELCAQKRKGSKGESSTL